MDMLKNIFVLFWKRKKISEKSFLLIRIKLYSLNLSYSSFNVFRIIKHFRTQRETIVIDSIEQR